MTTAMKWTLLISLIAVAGCQSSAPSDSDQERSGQPETPQLEEKDDSPTTADDETTTGDETTDLVYDPDATEQSSMAQVFTGRTEMTGYLRFSWLYLDEEPELIMRFFADDDTRSRLPEDALADAAEAPPVISLYAERTDDELVRRDEASMRDIIDEDFEAVPDHFLDYRDGHVQQPGTLVVESFRVEIMADRPYFFSRFVSFEPSPMEADPEELGQRLDAQAEAAGPQHSSVYEVSYYFPESGALYTAPDESSDVRTPLDAHQRVVKIRTVDDDWFEVSIDDGDTTGFVPKDAVELVN